MDIPIIIYEPSTWDSIISFCHKVEPIALVVVLALGILYVGRKLEKIRKAIDGVNGGFYVD